MNESRERFEDLSLYETWDDDYYRPDFVRFYDDVFAHFARETGIQPGDEVLEAGCGPCVHTIRLLESGYRATSVDFSATALAEGRKRLEAKGLLDKATLGQEDLTNLSFPDDSFPFIFCWGVIMHVPEPEKAIRELSRVLAPGGTLAISTNNASSLDKFLLEGIAYRFKRPRSLVDLGRSEMGRYAIYRDDGSDLFVQALFPKKLEEKFAESGVRVQSCSGVIFTELYTHLQSDRLRRILLGLNRFWFRNRLWPQLCSSHLVILKKDGSPPTQ